MRDVDQIPQVPSYMEELKRQTTAMKERYLKLDKWCQESAEVYLKKKRNINM
jgi:hypothetical protein